MGESVESKIFLLIHPSDEHKLDKLDQKLGFKLWNVGKHSRKFIKTYGNYIDSKTGKHEQNKEIAFWGEWEPESTFNEIEYPIDNYEKKYYPKFYHKPFYTNNPCRLYLQNTDPYVYGDYFYYCICQQPRVPALKEIPDNSIILFGGMIDISEKSNNGPNFVLDTVFVTKQSIRYNKDTLAELRTTININRSNKFYDIGSNRNILINKGYYDCTLDKLKIIDGSEYTLYEGINYTENANLFSYFPCASLGDYTMYKRVLLPLIDKSIFPKLINARSKDNHILNIDSKKEIDGKKINPQNYPCIKVEGIEPIEFWKKIKDYITVMGYNIGTKASQPENSANKKGPEYDYWEETNKYI